MKRITHQAPVALIHTVFLGCFCIALMVVDHRFHYLEVVRSNIATVVSPLRYLVHFPSQAGSWASEWFSAHTQLVNENTALRATLRLQNARLQKMQILQAENNRLRRLLGSSHKLADQVVVAELLSVDQNPYRQLIEINRGTADGIFTHHAVIDDFGIMGQVIHATQESATIILISDPDHATPIAFVRSGIRSVAFGTGNTNRLEIPYLPATADIRVGDQLVTSGLGGRFPADYPVASVSAIRQDSVRGFITVLAIPKARLDSSREVLVIKPQK